MPFFAHSENSAGQKHNLVTHLKNVAERASKFADKFGAADLGYWAGLWHDLGKFHPDFQTYIASPDVHRGPDHSSAGALHATGRLDWLAFLVAGHHAGLPSRTDLKNRLRDKADSPNIRLALETAARELSPISPDKDLLQGLPPFLRCQPTNADERRRLSLGVELFLRFVFSALVDADFLDTETHFDDERSRARSVSVSLEDLWQRFEKDQAAMTGQRDDLVNRIRHEIYQACLQAAEAPQGVFTLTVPTGGGKTRSGIAFALQHALHHRLNRVIVAIPYTSIIEQTADVYRDIFREGVLEHHSAVVSKTEPCDPVSQQEVWARLASENWDAPVVVTTTVQLFESLFANRAQPCRKLHNIARSVLILDEVQTLPTHLLGSILDVLQQLVNHYGVSVVLCTATQPAFSKDRYLKGLQNVREIIPYPARYFAALRRVRFELPQPGKAWPWERVAEEMRTSPQALTVVNTKRDAFALLDALSDPAALHLSTQICGAHRRQTLREVRRRLQAGELCRLVSTQVVEAGVDFDFPLVLRAIGPLDRIVQAAGRCNREGRLALGRVVIFDPAEGTSPQGVYRSGMNTAESLLAAGCDLDDPATYETYFCRLFQVTETDAKKIQATRESLNYPSVAERFRMIDDDSTPVVVRLEAFRAEVDEVVSMIRRNGEVPRWAFRRLQPFLVSIRSRLISAYEAKGLVQEIAPGLWEWLGGYDPLRGLVEGSRNPDELVI